MFDLYLFNAVNADFYNKIILYDKDHLLQLSDYLESFKHAGFQIIYYKNDLEFRKLCGKSIHDSKEKLLINVSIMDNLLIIWVEYLLLIVVSSIVFGRCITK